MKIAIVGTGYVGLVTGACFSEVGNDVLCLDLDEKKIRTLESGGIPIYEPGLSDVVKRNVAAGRLHFTTDVARAVSFGTVQCIAVGTPPGEDGSADLKHVVAAARNIGHVTADVARSREDVLHVGRPVLVGRGTDRDELQRAVRNGRVLIGREVQPACRDIARDHRRKPGLVDRNAAVLEHVDLLRVDVEAQHVVADFGEAGARNEADVPRTDHRHLHAGTPSESLIALSAATGSAACVIGRPITR